tara:strand:+ start:50291 stop:50806 length:516 start_codon:yes stop_codon:yes gene_type:complete
MPRSKNSNKDSKETKELEEQLVHTHYGLVVSQALRFSNNRSYIEDYIQVGLIGLLKAIRNYDSEKSKFSTFATVCIRNEIFRYTRKNKPKTIPVDAKIKNVINRTDDWYVPVEGIWEYIPDSLTEKERLVLQMKFENYTHKEIADTICCSKGRVKNILKKIISLLQRANGE